jgi:hypothetical protein
VTQSRPLIHSQTHQAQNTAEHEEATHRQALKIGDTGSDMVLYILETELYKKLQENVCNMEVM